MCCQALLVSLKVAQCICSLCTCHGNLQQPNIERLLSFQCITSFLHPAVKWFFFCATELASAFPEQELRTRSVILSTWLFIELLLW